MRVVRVKRLALLGWGLASFLMLSLPTESAAQDWENGQGDEEPGLDPYGAPPSQSSGVGMRGSIGFTADPGAFAMGLSVPIAMTSNIAFTPHMLIAFDDEDTIVAPSVNLEVQFRLGGRRGDFFYRLRPFLQAGLGFAYIETSNGAKDQSETGFLAVPGVGVEYEISESLLIGTNMRFNVLPGETSGESFFFSWELLSLRIAF